MRSPLRVFLPGLLLASSTLLAAPPAPTVLPATVVLDGPGATQRLIVRAAPDGAGRRVDLTRRARYASRTPEIVEVSGSGLLTPRGDGAGVIAITLEGLEAAILHPVEVRNTSRPSAPTLEDDVIPLLTRAGCNSGPCHGKARGQNGFQLSLLGFDPDSDHRAIAQEGRGRRIFPGDPDRSLLLAKVTGATPHGGGVRIRPGSRHHETLRRWIETGLPRDAEDVPALERVEVTPADRLLVYGETQQLLVTAHYSDGSRRDVTDLAAFQSSESPIVRVDEHGLIEAGRIPGEAAIMARYRGLVAVSRASIPLPGTVDPALYAALPRYNFIDGLVWTKLERLALEPSGPAPATTVLRRLHLDLIGRPPTPGEIREFVEDPRPDKYERRVDALLERPEYTDFWANKWTDLLRPNPYRVGIKAVFNLDGWIRDAFRRNQPYDEFVSDVLTARGSTFHSGAVTVYRDRRSPDELVTMMSQLFLGLRLECAKCHQHPFEAWSQRDFYSLAAFFSRVARKGTGLSPPISGGEEIIYLGEGGSVRHPITGEILPPRPPHGEARKIRDGEDPRAILAEWMVTARPDYFARVQVNRIWADLFGRGLVEPVDDLRATNPPSNDELLDALAAHFREVDFDLKRLLKTIVSSYAYGLSSVPVERNLADRRNYSRHYRQRLRAETLLDAIDQISGVPSTFAAMPRESLSTRLWTHRSGSLFLDTFGRPDPNQDPPCERLPETSVVQALHLMNSPELHRKITSDEGLAARLVAAGKSPDEVITELYLWTYNRYPDGREREICRALFPGSENAAEARRVAEDILWTLINTPEFVFKN